MNNNDKSIRYIEDYTRNCSNELCYEEGIGKLYEPWLTPDNARAAVEIARQEVIDKGCEWLRNYVNPTAGTYLFDEDIEKFRKAMKGE